MKRAVLILGVVAVLLAPARAPAGSYGTELPFVAGAGARASGMGLAGITLGGSPSSQYYNPAALALLEYREFEAYRMTLFDSDAVYLAASYAHPTLDFGTFGLSFLRIGVAGIEERDDANELINSDLTSTMSRALLGYAAGVTRSLALGANLKIDHQKVAGSSATGIGLDLGAAVTRAASGNGWFRGARAGVMLENVIEPSVKLDAEDVADPMRIGVGTSVDAMFDRFDITAALDLVRPRYSPLQFRAGLEARYQSLVSLRAGFDDDTPTFGTGVRFRGVSVDYAFRDEELGTNHRFSVSIAFGDSKTGRQRARQEQADAEMHERLGRRIREFEDGQLRKLVAHADSLFEAGEYTAAEAQYGSVLAWDPSNESAGVRKRECRFRFDLAEAHDCAEKGGFATALYHLRRAEQLQPGSADVAAQIKRCESRLRESANRATMVGQLLERSIDLYAAGDLSDALAGFREVLRIDPAQAMAREYERKTMVSIRSALDKELSRARTRAEHGDFAGARELIEQARALAPDDPRIAAELAAVEKRRQSQPLSAGPVVAAQPSSIPVADAVGLEHRYREGIAYFEQGRFKPAARELMVVWTASPAYRDVAGTLARAYLFLGMQAYSKGDYDQAIASWERVLMVDPENAKAARYLKSSREEASRLGATR